jgi:hypothetical protein
MVHDQADVITGPASPDQVAVVFDEERLPPRAALTREGVARGPTSAVFGTEYPATGGNHAGACGPALPDPWHP